MRIHQQANNEELQGKVSQRTPHTHTLIMSKLNEKEIGWNERFYLNKIPQYNYQNQPYSQYLRTKFRLPMRRIQPSRSKRALDHSIEKGKVSNKPHPGRNEEKIKEAIRKAFNDLKKLWQEKQLPDCHMEAMTKNFNREYNPNKILEAIKHEYWEINKNSSLIQKVMSSIESRESCLAKVWEICNKIENCPVERINKQFQLKIVNLRTLTIQCIESIFQWRKYVEALGMKGSKAHFLYNGAYYGRKVQDDYRRIAKSQIKALYSLDGERADVFFVNYTREGRKISNVSKNLMKRIRLCEIMISEEASLSPRRSSKLEVASNLCKREETLPGRLTPPPEEKEAHCTRSPWKRVPCPYDKLNDYLSSMLAKGEFSDSFIPCIEMAQFEEITILEHCDGQQQVILAVNKFASNRKVIVLGLSSKLSTSQHLFKALADYLWEHDHCTELRVPLVHRKIGEVYTVDKELEKTMKGVGFRWASVNNNNNIRMTIYNLKRPLNKAPQAGQTYPIIVHHLVTLSESEFAEGAPRCPNHCLPSVLDLIRVSSEGRRPLYDRTHANAELSPHLKAIEKIKDYLVKEAVKEETAPLQPEHQYFSYSGMRSFLMETQQSYERIFSDLQIEKKQTDYPCLISVLNSSFKFNHVTIRDAKYTKFLPNRSSEILIMESKYPIYLLSTDEENINFFVIEVDGGFSMHEVPGLLKNIGNQSSFLEEFWLPDFRKSSAYTDEAGLACSEVVSTAYSNSLGSLTRKAKKRTKIIKSPFVFGMINKTMFKMLEIPFYSTLIRKEDLL